MKIEQRLKVVEPAWSSPSRVRALCTTRHGGYSDAPYDSLNLAAHVGDDSNHVLANRELLQKTLSLPAEPNWLEQTHSTRVVILEENASRIADAAITRQTNNLAVVMTADCLPVLLCNRAGSEVAAIHAGWRGLADGVIETTLRQMQSPADELMAWIGPGISQQCFEVGDEVWDIFVAQGEHNQRYFKANRPGHWLCDLHGLATAILSRYGITEIARASACSYSDESCFFSYRRNASTGRMASLIWIES